MHAISDLVLRCTHAKFSFPHVFQNIPTNTYEHRPVYGVWEFYLNQVPGGFKEHLNPHHETSKSRDMDVS